MRTSPTTVLAALAALFAGPLSAGESEFASKTIDLGVVVSDIDKAAKFYTEAVGFTEVEGFTVPADFGTKSGLTENHPLNIRVFVLGEGEGATKIKLMQLPGVKSKESDEKFIHSTLGFSYLTIFVADLDASLERLKKAKIEPVSEGGAVPLPEGFPEGVALTLIKDPDGNIIELVGPKK